MTDYLVVDRAPVAQCHCRVCGTVYAVFPLVPRSEGFRFGEICTACDGAGREAVS